MLPGMTSATKQIGVNLGEVQEVYLYKQRCKPQHVLGSQSATCLSGHAQAKVFRAHTAGVCPPVQEETNNPRVSVTGHLCQPNSIASDDR